MGVLERSSIREGEWTQIRRSLSMRNLLKRMWNDDAGFIVSAELVFIFTIMVLGLLVGWVHVRNAVATELTDVANAIAALDQSYTFAGLTDTCGTASASTAGSALVDTSNGPLGLTTVAAVPVASAVGRLHRIPPRLPVGRPRCGVAPPGPSCAVRR